MERLINELDEAYTFAIDNCDTSDPDGLETYRLMQQCIEQYRREYCGRLFKTLDKKTVREIGQGEIHLNLHGTIQERLEQILANDGNFLAYVYKQDAKSTIGSRKSGKKYHKARRKTRTESRKEKRNPREINDIG